MMPHYVIFLTMFRVFVLSFEEFIYRGFRVSFSWFEKDVVMF